MKDVVRAIVYDLDNTLIATNEYVQQHMIETTDAVLGEEKRRELLPVERIRTVQARNLPFERIFEDLFGEEQGKVILAAYRETAPDKPYFATPGGVETVTYFNARGVSQGILTNRTKMARVRLDQAGYGDFDYIFSPASKEVRKPDPRAFDPVMAELSKKGIPAGETMSIGDHTTDYLAAKRAGIGFCAVLTGLTPAIEFERQGLETDNIVENLEELLESMKG